MKKLENNLDIDMLLTSGSMGKELFILIMSLRYQIKIQTVIFCKSVDFHKTWSRNYDSVKLVTASYPEVEKFSKTIVKNGCWKYSACVPDLRPFGTNEYHIRMKMKMLKYFSDDSVFIKYLKDTGKDNIITNFTKGDALKIYTGNGIYRELNHSLRVDNIQEMLPFVPLINKINDKMLELKNTCKASGMKVWRQMKIDEDQKKGFKELMKAGSMLIFPAYTSATEDEKVLDTFPGNIKLHISIPNDITMYEIFYPIKVAKYSQFPNENEVLFLPASVFQINDVIEKENSVLKLEIEYITTLLNN